MFYEPKISKPIRPQRSLTIKLNNQGQLEGLPTAWREALDLPPQIEEVEEIDETLQVDKRKVQRIERAAAEAAVVFELTEVVRGGF